MLYARINTFEGDPGRFAQTVRNIEDLVIPGLRDLDGFKGVVGLLENETGTSITITFWESEEAMDASEAASANIRIQSMLPEGVSLVRIQRCEVAELFIKSQPT